MTKVVQLAAFIPAEVRETAKRAYAARKEYEAALERKVAWMRALSVACKKHGIDPDTIEVGDLTGTSLVPFDHNKDSDDGSEARR